MRFETLADLLYAYDNKQLSKSNPLIIDREEQIAYVEKPENERVENSEDYEDNFLFYLNFPDLIIEAIEILGIPSESD